MPLMKGQDQQQNVMQGQVPQQQQQPTLMQRAIKREKWIIVFSVLLGIAGTLEAVFTDKGTVSDAFVGTIFSIVFFSIINFIAIPYFQTIYYKSKQASQQYWNQKF